MNPATTSCKRNRVHNIDTDRLRRRREFLVIATKQYSRMYESRCDFVARVCELAAIERELVARGMLDTSKRVTTL